ncbi:hypothetical protein HJG60_001792 [Phyllostomus discolor]|uniref:Uncharacterized protein n=1 Tax=Phyllostomus discolor TaxID=89673 RepID=A0A834DPA7_9CHIR|nr:hypothetical protein HJG60_001792 [Phyllostomus discolor]
MKTWISIQPGYSKPTMLRTGQLRNPQEPLGKRLDSAKAKFRLLKVMLRNRQISLQELRNQEDFLTKFNQDLIKTIQDMEDSSARKMRSMLQQQNVFGTIVHLLAYSNEKKLQQMKCELQEWKENEDSKMSYLKQQVEQLSAKIKKTQEEVNFLSTYMDHEYPVKVVRIDNLVHQLQQVKDNQQDELDDLNEMLKKVLESLSQEIQMKRKKLLNSLVVKTQEPCQEVLLQKISENHNMVKHADKFREFPLLFPSVHQPVQAGNTQIEGRGGTAPSPGPGPARDRVCRHSAPETQVYPRHGRHPQHPRGRAATLLGGRATAAPPSLLSPLPLEP